MQKRKPQIPKDANTVEELDALVIAEIESLSGGRRRLSAGNGEKGIAEATPPAAETDVVQLRDPEQDGEVFSGEDAAGLFDAPFDQPADLAEVAQDGQAAVGGLYTAEEDAFITRAVGFLAQRDNADVILNQIWQQVMEGFSEDFYRPPETPLPVSPSELATDSAGEETRNAAVQSPKGDSDPLDVGCENND